MGWKTTCCIAGTALALGAASVVVADEVAPDRLIQTMANDVLKAVARDPALHSGNVAAVTALVDRLVMPHTDMAQLTALAMGRHWRTASEDQQQRLEAEFKTLIVRTYAGALAQTSTGQSVETRPLRAAESDVEVVVSTSVRGRAEPVRIDYRLRRRDDGWKIYDAAVLGVWLAANYRSSFSEEIGRSGIEGLIARLHSRNQEIRTPPADETGGR